MLRRMHIPQWSTKGLLRDRQGSVVIVVALSIFVIAGFAALAVDMAQWPQATTRRPRFSSSLRRESADVWHDAARDVVVPQSANYNVPHERLSISCSRRPSRVRTRRFRLSRSRSTT